MSQIVRAIRESEIEECLDLWMTVWPEASRRYFRRYFFGDIDFQPEYTRVCEVDGRLVSAVHIVKRIVSCGDCTLTMGGIANVATLPEYRGRGCNTACLRSAIEIMAADAMDFSVLFTGNHGFYEREGWESLEGWYWSGRLAATVERTYSYAIVRPYESYDDAAIHLIHAAFNRSRPIAVRRTSPYWRDWIGWQKGMAPGRARVAEVDGSIVGYLLYEIDAASAITRVKEIGWRDGAAAAAAPLLAYAAEDSLAHGVNRIRIPLHDEPAIREEAMRLCISAEPAPSGAAMVRFLHRDNLLRGLAPELTNRWMEAGSPRGALTFTGPYGPSRIAADGGFLRIEAVDFTPGALSQAELFGLLTGKGIPEGRIRNEDRPFANALFPPARPWYWELDGF